MTTVDATTTAARSAPDTSSGDRGAAKASTSAVLDSRQPAGDNGQDVESSLGADAVSSLSHAADWQRRQRYFIEKLRFEFAVRDIIERRTGKPASWDRTAVYLRDLAAELQTNQGMRTLPVIRGIGRDLAVIEMMLGAEIDNLLVSVGETPALQSWYQLRSPPADSRAAAAQKLDALTQKFELLDYAAKVLAVMDNR